MKQSDPVQREATPFRHPPRQERPKDLPILLEAVESAKGIGLHQPARHGIGRFQPLTVPPLRIVAVYT